jgi:hypothetical protein
MPAGLERKFHSVAGTRGSMRAPALAFAPDGARFVGSYPSVDETQTTVERLRGGGGDRRDESPVTWGG